ncbi:NAD(P)-binding protein [Armillaria borealis]|uniref:NAD(P)-binding protein n=1 Tax=Armillaria borealis TaxID=47425 RepID=A0AA39MKH4_9AGAR|nr:NAD(P)-binding protein [Armillaria borealis]
MAPKVYLITGANRGIGLALVNELAAKNSNISIFAGVRNPSAASSLEELSKKYLGKIIIVKYISADKEGNKVLAKEIDTKHGHLDVVITCASIATYMGTALETPANELWDHFDVNITGILVLFQSVYSLLKASTSSPRFIPLSPAAASLTAFISLPARYTCYVCFPLTPGIVDMDMLMDTTGTLAPIQDALAISAKKAATLLLGIIENATQENDGGEFINVDGQKLTW